MPNGIPLFDSAGELFGNFVPGKDWISPPKPGGGCGPLLGLLLGVLTLGAVASFSFYAIFGGPVLAAEQASINGVMYTMMRAQVALSGSDWIKPSYQEEASKISRKEVGDWRKRYPELRVTSSDDIRPIIVVLKHHPDWKLRVDRGSYMALKGGTFCYRFMTKEGELKDVPFEFEPGGPESFR